MTYLQTNNRSSGRSRITLGIIGLFIVLALMQFFIPHVLPALWSTVARPFWRIEFSLGSGSLRSPEQLLSENEELKRQLAEINVRLDTIRATEDENKELKALLGRSSDDSSTTSPVISPSKKLLAAVLRRPPSMPYDELIIDIGADYKVAKDDIVYASGNVRIGKVAEVSGSTSKVSLFSSPGKQYEVLIGSGHVPATAIGRGGGQYEAQVSRDIKINEGDFVLVSSISDHPFGVVTKVISDPTQPFEVILFAPPVNIYQLRWVLVENSKP